MDRTGGRDRRLERIVALLVALAELAERVAGRSFPVRWLVLFLLRRAEAAVSVLVAEAMRCEWDRAAESGGTGSGPADAILLAARLRTLAALLAALLPAPWPFPRSDGRGGGPGGSALPAACLAVASGEPAATPHDTT